MKSTPEYPTDYKNTWRDSATALALDYVVVVEKLVADEVPTTDSSFRPSPNSCVWRQYNH